MKWQTVDQITLLQFYDNNANIDDALNSEQMWRISEGATNIGQGDRVSSLDM